MKQKNLIFMDFHHILGSFTLKIQAGFEAGHYLYRYYDDGSDEKIHGHSWKVSVEVLSEGKSLKNGMSIDFLHIQKNLKELIAEFDHNLINQHPDFKENNPTTEHIAYWFYCGLAKELPQNCRLIRVTLVEGPGFSACYEPPGN